MYSSERGYQIMIVLLGLAELEESLVDVYAYI